MRARASKAPASAATTEKMGSRDGDHMRQTYRFHIVVQAALFELASIAYHNRPHERRPAPSNSSNTSRAKQRADTTNEIGPMPSTIVACVNFRTRAKPARHIEKTMLRKIPKTTRSPQLVCRANSARRLLYRHHMSPARREQRRSHQARAHAWNSPYEPSLASSTTSSIFPRLKARGTSRVIAARNRKRLPRRKRCPKNDNRNNKRNGQRWAPREIEPLDRLGLPPSPPRARRHWQYCLLDQRVPMPSRHAK